MSLKPCEGVFQAQIINPNFSQSDAVRPLQFLNGFIGKNSSLKVGYQPIPQSFNITAVQQVVLSVGNVIEDLQPVEVTTILNNCRTYSFCQETKSYYFGKVTG